ncbi:MAG: type II toxin-antitoxin system VapC family toxin [Deltaproteobacteria bacterium]|nr:type II toxin-antitoxin system VapC family toxin [Deltaproteobacteria bacterium]
MNKVFLDASYAIALSVVNDQYHQKAEMLAIELETRAVPMITTRAVILEIGNALAKLRYRKAAVELLDSIEEDPNIEVIPISKGLYDRAMELYRQRLDKEWGITDCISFIVMQDYGLTKALTTDQHFKQAGFAPLLLD